MPSVRPMPVILHIEHRIVEFDRWLEDFASRAPAREQVGVSAVHVFQAEGDPQQVVELLYFDTADDANTYRTFMREDVWSSSSPGLDGNPHAIILNEVDTTSKSQA